MDLDSVTKKKVNTTETHSIDLDIVTKKKVRITIIHSINLHIVMRKIGRITNTDIISRYCHKVKNNYRNTLNRSPYCHKEEWQNCRNTVLILSQNLGDWSKIIL